MDVEGVKINFFRDKSGKSNFSFLTDTTGAENPDTVSLLPDISLKSFSIKDLTCYYSDSAILAKGAVYIPELNLSGRVKGESYSGSVKGVVDISEVDFEDTNLDRMKSTTLDIDLDYVDDSLSVNNLLMISDGVKMKVTGTALVRDKVFADINISSEDFDIAVMKKYVPDDTLKNYGIKDIAGNMMFNVKIRGVVSDTAKMPAVDADIWLKNGSVSFTEYPSLKDLSFTVAFTNGEKRNEETSEVKIKEFRFHTDNGKGDLRAVLKNFNRPWFSVKGDLDLYLSDFDTLIPDSLADHVEGNVRVRFSSKGNLPDSITDVFINGLLENSMADVSFKNVTVLSDSFPDVKGLYGSIVYRPGMLKVDSFGLHLPDYNLNLRNSSFNISMEGELTDPAKTTLDIHSFLVQTGKSSFEGNAYIDNLISPEFRIKTNMVLDLKEAAEMLPDDSLVTDMSGVVRAVVISSGHLDPDSIEDQINEILFRKTDITAELNHVSVAMPDTLMCVDGLSGRFTVVPDSLMLEDVDGSYRGLAFSVPRIQIVNLYNTVVLNRKEKLVVEGEFGLGDVDYALFAPFVEDTASGSEESEPVNYNFQIKGKLHLNSFKYDKAVFRNISALYNLTDSLYIVDKFRFDAFGGSASNSVRYRMLPGDKAVINTKHLVEQMDIHKLLLDFDSFKEYGNNEIEAKNLSGLFSTNLHTKVVMIGDSVIENETRVKGDMKIENGGIYNYKAAMDMAEFTKLKELDSIRFKTFDSKIFMFKNKLYVPKTYIVSSALDIGFFGMQSLGEDYEYHIQLHLGDVLKGKSQRLLKRQAESGDEVTEKDLDRSTVKLIYAFINGKSKVGFDKKKLQRRMQVRIMTQEKMLDLIFFPKLVSFDTGVKE